MNKPNHSDISQAALTLYLRHEKVEKTFDKLRDYLGVSSASEDDVTFSSQFQRPFNWHFYNNNGLISDNILVPGQRTSEKRFATLLEKLDHYVAKYSAKPDRHHIEDLAAIPDHPATPVNTRCCKMAFVNIFEKSSA